MKHEDPSKKDNKWEELSSKKESEEQESLPTTEENEQLSTNSLSEQLAEAHKQIKSSQDALLRARAEFENLEKKKDREMQNSHKFSQEKLLKELLVVMDNLERSLEVSGAEEKALASVLAGVRLTLKLLRTVLEKFGLAVINPEGQLFDPHFHEAMTTEVQNHVAPNTVLKVLQKGYTLHERVIRPALVVVAVTQTEEKSFPET